MSKYYLPLVVDTTNLTEVTKIAQRAQELGYHGIGVGEHYSLPGRPSGRPDGFVVLSMLAATTANLELGTLAASATVRHPVLLANSALSLHLLSGGRSFLCLGVGSGKDAEYSSHGFPYVTSAQRLDAFEEALAIIRGLSLNRGGFSYGGKVYALHDSTLNLTGDFPPIWVGERRSKRLLRLGGRYADVLNIHCTGPAQAQEKMSFARSVAAKAGRAKSDVRPVLKHFVVTETDQDLLAEALGYSGLRKEGEGRVEFIERMKEEDPEAIIGTPDEVRGNFEGFVEAGFEEFSPILLPNTAGKIKEHMELFAKRCMV
ncbi:MAG: LLM class flavin-dependent oxidoreductase [Nitrososphaerota archaeon]|jgi:alkanesulfonate monooxygenase SsuD/methylene tetrahydromethanopterin reductase-like flavin-dependent oxidoreductase (luciferase family)|nr:LLM class flavin-dependent oxidoreductase [Nitrososphaerota archaeon]MDG6945813.1 LLM class flavin-dependent oxidoreductase [Nitrososphaerota archaeon]